MCLETAFKIIVLLWFIIFLLSVLAQNVFNVDQLMVEIFHHFFEVTYFDFLVVDYQLNVVSRGQS